MDFHDATFLPTQTSFTPHLKKIVVVSYLWQMMFNGMAMCSRGGGHVMRRAIDFEDEGQRKKMTLNRTWKKQAEEKV